MKLNISMKKSGILFMTPLLLVTVMILLSGCASLHKGGKKGNSLLKLEELIIPLEAMGGSEARKNEAKTGNARQALVKAEKEAGANEEYRGKIAAWSGRLAILEGKYSEARSLYRQSITLCPGYIPMTVLGIRLEGDPARRLELAERELLLSGGNTAAPGYGQMHIEKARSLLELNRYAEAVKAFDAAFNALQHTPVYRESYQRDRDRANELRGSGV